MVRNGDEISGSMAMGVEIEKGEPSANQEKKKPIGKAIGAKISRFVVNKKGKWKRKKNKKSNRNQESESVSESNRGRTSNHQIKINCFSCFNQPQVENPDSPLSAEALKSLIETNEFYAAECNVHRDYWD